MQIPSKSHPSKVTRSALEKLAKKTHTNAVKNCTGKLFEWTKHLLSKKNNGKKLDTQNFSVESGMPKSVTLDGVKKQARGTVIPSRYQNGIFCFKEIN